mmetsp:Transcript_37799/g.55678  ORF Transcript_37799/g.55678 Transcript_37799/m.55678 type:complete len:106 (-) Transcript_37799:817-1134(-)
MTRDVGKTSWCVSHATKPFHGVTSTSPLIMSSIGAFASTSLYRDSMFDLHGRDDLFKDRFLSSAKHWDILQNSRLNANHFMILFVSEISKSFCFFNEGIPYDSAH